MQTKLSSLNKKSLSFVGRCTLMQSVLSTIPNYCMQTMKIPMTVCAKIDKLCRDFLWGSSEDDRKIHLLSWEKICKPKEEGGLEIRRAQEINQLFLMKLAWGLTYKRESLWVQVMRANTLHRISTINPVSPNNNAPEQHHLLLDSSSEQREPSIAMHRRSIPPSPLPGEILVHECQLLPAIDALIAAPRCPGLGFRGLHSSQSLEPHCPQLPHNPAAPSLKQYHLVLHSDLLSQIIDDLD
ncbi:hypothetical protein AHAS_Ahas12G0205300 [Arachis hypogaea]